MKIRAAVTAVGLSLLFVVVYSTTNWLASQRSEVGSWYYQWELSIPFVPLMIIPYMSIDLFFVAAPFFCRDRAELSIFTRRVVFAILVAGLCFTLFPLKLGFERHPVTGWLGTVFNPFLQLDKPFNLLPSLHLTFRTILVDLYARKTKGLLNALVHIWFSLIGISTLLTHQHQVVDVIGGFFLAGYSIYLFHPHGGRLSVRPNPRVAGYYLLLAAALVGMAAATWREGILFLWPAVAAGIVALAYLGFGPGIYRKADGRLPFSTRFVLGPILLGQYLSLFYYRRQCRPWDRFVPGVLIGRVVDDRLADEAIASGVRSVLDLTAEFSEAKPFLNADYRNLPILDLTAPSMDQLSEMATWIAEHTPRGDVYIHCKIGYSRSAAAAGAYLLASGQAQDAAEAIERLRAARPSVVVRPEIRDALDRFANELPIRHS